jgi:anti-sigma factor RsiW
VTKPNEPVTEFDLVAYADDRLDPARAAEVERYLEQNPEAAEKVAAFRAQNQALHAAYDRTLSEAVPPRLAETLTRTRPRRRPVRVARAAALAIVMLATGLSGWMIGRTSEAGGFAAETFATRAARAHNEVAGIARGRVDSQREFSPLQWLTRHVSLELRAPGLNEEGLALVARRRIELAGEPAVQLIYRTDDGERLSVFLRRRWHETRPTIHLTETHGLTMAYWLDGPLAYGVAGTAEAARLKAIARRIDREMSIEPQVAPGSLGAAEASETNAGEGQAAGRM